MRSVEDFSGFVSSFPGECPVNEVIKDLRAAEGVSELERKVTAFTSRSNAEVFARGSVPCSFSSLFKRVEKVNGKVARVADETHHHLMRDIRLVIKLTSGFPLSPHLTSSQL